MPLPADFLSMLTMTGSWAKHTGHDQWGNEVYAAPVAIQCFITSQTTAFGTEDGQNKQEEEAVTTVEVITDALGITPKDYLTLYGTTYFVTNVDTPQDETGADLLHTVTATSSKKG